MTNVISILDEAIPNIVSLSFFKEKVLMQTSTENDFLQKYFLPPARLIVCFPSIYFQNLNTTLSDDHRSQMIGLIALFRYPLAPNFLDKKSLKYGSENLHRLKRIFENKENIFGDNYYSFEELDKLIPSDLTKKFLAYKLLERISRTGDLNKYFTDEVLKTMGLKKEKYDNLKSFFFYRDSIIGLLLFFKIKIKNNVRTRRTRIKAGMGNINRSR